MCVNPPLFPLRTLLLSMVLKATAPSTPVIKCTGPVIVFRVPCCRETRTSSLSAGRFHMASSFTGSSPLHGKNEIAVDYCFSVIVLIRFFFDWILSELLVSGAQQKQASRINQCLFVALEGAEAFVLALVWSCKEDKSPAVFDCYFIFSFCAETLQGFFPLIRSDVSGLTRL